jgi:hypothetical protein
MTAKTILAQWLRDHGYDGLCYADCECGCGVDDLMPCGETCEQCTPAFKAMQENGIDEMYFVRREDAERWVAEQKEAKR